MIRQEIKQHLQETQKACQANLSNGNKKMLWRSCLDQPVKRLPKIFRFIQQGAFIVRLTEFKDDKVIKEKEYTFHELDKAVDDFLSGIDENKIAFY